MIGLSVARFLGYFSALGYFYNRWDRQTYVRAN